MIWFRHYVGMIRDPKLISVAACSKQTLERVAFVWAAMLESASESNGDETFHVTVEEVSYTLRCDVSDVEIIKKHMIEQGLIRGNKIIKWKKRQFLSDNSTPRVQRLREKKRQCNVSETAETVAVTAPDTDTDTDTDTEKKASKRLAPLAEIEEPNFIEFWRAYPKRAGNNPRAPALLAFRKALAKGADPRAIIAGALRYAEGIRADGKERTAFVVQATRWFNEERWNDEYVKEKHLDRSGKQGFAEVGDDLRREWFGGTSPDNAPGIESRPTPALLLPINGGGRPEDLHFSGSPDPKPVYGQSVKPGDEPIEGACFGEPVVALRR